MPAWLQSIGQGLGRAGNEWGEAVENNTMMALDVIKNKLVLQEIQQRIRESQQREQRANQPQPYGIVPGQGGAQIGVTFDQNKPQGQQFGQQTIIPGGARPEFKTPQEEIAWAVAHGDDKLLGHAIDAIRATQRPAAPAKPTEFDEWRDQFHERNKRYPNDIEIAQWHRQPRVAGEGGALSPAQQKAADSWVDKYEKGEVTMAQVPKAYKDYVAQNAGSPTSDNKIRGDAIKASDAARSAYTNMQSAKEDAQSNNARGHLSLVFHAVRSMVAGAGRMTQTEVMAEAQAGSYGQRLQRWAQMATEGTLPADQVQQILGVVQADYNAKRLAGKQAWTYAYPDRPLPPWLQGQGAQPQLEIGGGSQGGGPVELEWKDGKLVPKSNGK